MLRRPSARARVQVVDLDLVVGVLAAVDLHRLGLGPAGGDVAVDGVRGLAPGGDGLDRGGRARDHVAPREHPVHGGLEGALVDLDRSASG